MTEPPEDAEPWQREAWGHMPRLLSQFDPLFDAGYYPRGHGQSSAGAAEVESRVRDLPTGWGHLPVDVDFDEVERSILYARDEYERRLGVRPTVIDLPNWVRGTILEQIAFNNGFTIADRRAEPTD